MRTPAGIGDVLDPLGIFDSVAGAATGAMFDGLSNWVADAVAWLTGQVGEQLSTLVSHPGYSATRLFEAGGPAANIKWIAACLMSVGMIVSVFVAANGGESATKALEEAPLTVLGTTLVVFAGTLVLGICDLFAGKLLTGETWKNFADFGDAPGFVRFFCSLIAFVAVLLVFLELAIRNLLVVIALTVMPLGLAFRMWPFGRELLPLMVRGFLALALQPVFIALTLRAIPTATGPDRSWDFGQALLQLAGLLLVVVMPGVVFKLLPLDSSGVSGGYGFARGAVVGATVTSVRMGTRAASAIGSGGTTAAANAAATAGSRVADSARTSTSTHTQSHIGGRAADSSRSPGAGGSTTPHPGGPGQAVSGGAGGRDGASGGWPAPAAASDSAGVGGGSDGLSSGVGMGSRVGNEGVR